MILKKEHIPNIGKIEDNSFLSNEEKEFVTNFIIKEQEYRYALRKMSAKLENLDDYCEMHFDHNPIHHIESRIKTAASLVEKIHRRGLNLSLDVLGNGIYDVAGIRVVCNYINDIYKIEQLLLTENDIEVLLRKDYILNPKDTGYRSLHDIYLLAINIDGEEKKIPIEIQFRTIAMDMWASLEHELRYKSSNNLDEEDIFKLKSYSDILYDLDLNMQRLYIKTITGDSDND